MLLAADGVGTNEIVTRVGVSKPTVIAWKKRFTAAGVAGLADLPKPGRPASVDETAVVLATLEPPPERLGVTHWSSRLLAEHLSREGAAISNVWVARIWRKWGLQPWRQETFKFSTDPALEAKVRDVVGLYLNPPDKAVVLSIDEKSQIQALNRTAPQQAQSVLRVVVPSWPDRDGTSVSDVVWGHSMLGLELLGHGGADLDPADVDRFHAAQRCHAGGQAREEDPCFLSAFDPKAEAATSGSLR